MTKHTLTARIALFLALAALVPLAAQSGGSGAALLNVGEYSKLFLNGNGKLATKYILALSDKEHGVNVANLGGNQTIIDTPLEISLLSYAAGVIDVRPADADAILPANNPRVAGLKLGSAVLKELAELKFLDPSNTAAVGRYEGMIKFISDRNGVSRADMQDYLARGIAAAVDAEFNKVVFYMENSAIKKGYSVALTRTANNQYILEYEGVYQGKDFNDKLPPANSLEALLSAMSSRNTDFDRNCINTVRAQAALIPAAALGAQSLNAIKIILTSFYTNPNAGTYGAVRDIYILFTVKGAHPALENARLRYGKTLATLNTALSQKVFTDANQLWVVTAFTVAQQQELTNNLQ